MQEKKRVPMNLFSQGLPEDIEYLCRKFKDNGYEIFLVGGAVRDLIIKGGYQPGVLSESDYDFATSATPDEVMELFKQKGKSHIFTVPTGLVHGTVTVVIRENDNSRHYEVTTYRIDGAYEDGRHPSSVKFSSSIEEDLSRRDFTVNAMAYDVLEKTLIDPFGGLKDIEKKNIRTVGKPEERFREDGLRPIRACRLAAQLDFTIEKETLDCIPGLLDVVSKVSMERVHDELLKLMKSREPSVGLEYLRQCGILKLYIPELLEGYQLDQNEFHRFDVYYHNLYTCDAAPKTKPLVRLGGLFHDIGKPRAKHYAQQNGNGNVFYNHEIIGERMADRIMKRLKFSNDDLAYVKKLVKMHMFYYTTEWSDGAVRRFLRKIEGDQKTLDDLFDLRKADRIGSGMRAGETEILDRFRDRIVHILEEDNALKVTDLDINGNEIIERFQLKPSKIIGEMLEYMLEKVLDNPEYNRKDKLFEIGEEFLKLPQGERNEIHP